MRAEPIDSSNEADGEIPAVPGDPAIDRRLSGWTWGDLATRVAGALAK